jgi:hypothetical protein
MTETPMTYDATPTAGVEKKRGTAWGMYTALFVLFLFNAATIAGGVWLWQQLSVEQSCGTSHAAGVDGADRKIVRALKSAVEKQAEEAETVSPKSDRYFARQQREIAQLRPY